MKLLLIVGLLTAPKMPNLAASAAKAEKATLKQAQCKNYKASDSWPGWAEPPINILVDKTQVLRYCHVDYMKVRQTCVYTNDEVTRCSLLVDAAGRGHWEHARINCETGDLIPD